MISLPASLAPWSKQLSVFPNELSMAIGPLVQRIASAIDALHLEDVPGDDDPDGFDGLVNRGSYERLIASDWLLADEIPEEFERRATMREHLFLKTAKRDRAHGLGSVVLFDSGPDQLGSPRLAHLAILVVLIRRADRARANFAWRTLQNSGLPFLHGASESEMIELLRARTSTNVSDSMLNDWINRSLETNRPEEIWLVGGERLHQISPHHVVSRVKVEDVLEPQVRQVSVEIQRPKGRPRRILLDLPDNGACARLLRDPYQVRVSIPRKFSTMVSSSGLVFAHGGRRLFNTTGDGTLMSFPVPNSPWDTPGNAKRHTLGNIGRIVAANRLGRSTIIVSVEEISLRISYVGKESYPPAGHYFLRLDQFAWPGESDQALLFPCVRPPVPQGDKSSLFVLDASGNLFRLTPEPDEPVALLEQSGVLALTSREGVPAFVSVDKTRNTVEYTSIGRELFRGVVLSGAEGVEQAFFGFGADAQAPFCLLAIQKSPNRWLVVSGQNRSRYIQTEQRQEIVGVIQEPNYAEALVSLRENRHVVTLKGPDWERTLFESPDSIAHLTVCQGKPWIAYSTTKGDVTVYSVPLARGLCRYLNEDRND
jgi:hypothetical protein